MIQQKLYVPYDKLQRNQAGTKHWGWLSHKLNVYVYVIDYHPAIDTLVTGMAPRLLARDKRYLGVVFSSKKSVKKGVKVL